MNERASRLWLAFLFFKKNAPREPVTPTHTHTHAARNPYLSVHTNKEPRLLQGFFLLEKEGFLAGVPGLWGSRGGGSRGKWDHFDNAFLSNWGEGGRLKRSCFWKRFALFVFVLKHFPFRRGRGPLDFMNGRIANLAGFPPSSLFRLSLSLYRLTCCPPPSPSSREIDR